MKVEIRPSKARGVVTAPPSKSMAHRLLICAGLCEGESIVRRIALSDDIRATIACLRALGAEVTIQGDDARIKGIDPRKPLMRTAVLPCGESGSTLRFFIPLCLLCGEERVLTGSEYLMTRPLSVYEDLAREKGFRFETYPDRVVVQGMLKGGVYTVPGNISSQFITGLLLASAIGEFDSELRVVSGFESRPYVDMTVDAMARFGMMTEHEELPEQRTVIYRTARTQAAAGDVTVEGDYSNAAFLDALNIAGGEVTVTGLRADSLQGDRVYAALFRALRDHRGEIDISNCPDLGPVLFAVAALCGGGSFTGTRRLRFKESDRIDAMRQELAKCGVEVRAEENTAVITGSLRAPRVPLSGHGDHRIVMALSVLLSVVGGVIEGAEHINKSFPDFFDKLADLGVDLTYGMDQ